MTKRCTKCERDLNIDQFHLHKTNVSGLDHRCKDCCAERFLKMKYGISIQTYNELLQQQNGICAICNVEQCKSGRRFCVDHDHKTGHIRGLLCRACNLGIGYLGDNPDNFTQAIKYLTKQ